MDIDEDEIYEVMLVNLRLATWLDLPDERKILADSLLRSGVSEEVVRVWQQPSATALQAEVAELYASLSDYEPMIEAFPDIFRQGIVGNCCTKIHQKVVRFASKCQSSNLNAPPI